MTLPVLTRSSAFAAVCTAGVLLIASACGSNNQTSPSSTSGSGSGSGTSGSTTGGTISALLDGAQWSGSLTSRATFTAGSGVLSITGQDPTFRVLTMAIAANAVGTYSVTFPTPNLANWVVGTGNWSTAAQGGQGSVTVATMTTNRVTGTFTLTIIPSFLNTAAAMNTVRFTSGQFDMALERF